MRLPTALSLRAVLPAAALAFAPALYGVPAYAAEAEPAACGDRNASDFPIEAHLRGGPDQYALGGGWRGWHLELRNATDTGCRAIHPIAVLVDQAHQLRPRHIGFEFLDPSADGGAIWRTVSFQTTDEDENIGVFDDHFKGFTVPAHKTVDVQVRTRFTADAPEGPVTANAIAVQRRADDGDWVGQSNDYVFRIGGAATGPGTGSDTDAGTTGTGTGTGTTGPDAGTRTRAATRSGGLTEAGTDTGVGAGAATDGDAETKPAPEPTTRSKRPTATPSRTSEETASAAPSRKPSATRSLGAIHKESSPAAVPPRADSDVDADTEADADVGAEADIDSDPSAEEDAGTGADTGTDTDSELGADVDTDMDTDLGADTDPGSDSSADADTGTDTETGTDTGTGTETGTEAGSDTGTGTDLDEGLETDTDLGTETDPGTDVGTDLGTDTGLGTETDDPGAETDPGREPQTEPSTGTGTGSDGRHEEDGGHEREHERMPELAATGRHTALLVGLGVISAALVTCGTVLVVRSRRSGV
ncbi:hypothetical protein [Streptomyces iranensis]|uniref:hypothetical protein n=1 Tax=Streptomyces iranensis TaxID=576784 RepID=UPI0039B74BB7